MHQLTLRVQDALAERLKLVAAQRGESVNAYATAVLSAAVDPDLADTEAARLRERLARAGLLAPADRSGRRPDPASVERARRRAGVGRPLSELIGEDRR